MATNPFSQGPNRATAVGRQSESPSICTSLENTALLCLLCCGSVAQSASYDSDHWYFSIHTSPHWAICSNLTTADSGQLRPCLLLTFSRKASNNKVAVNLIFFTWQGPIHLIWLQPLRNTAVTVFVLINHKYRCQYNSPVWKCEYMCDFIVVH